MILVNYLLYRGNQLSLLKHNLGKNDWITVTSLSNKQIQLKKSWQVKDQDNNLFLSEQYYQKMFSRSMCTNSFLALIYPKKKFSCNVN